MDVLDFYRNKRVLITGHTGFKGSWLSRILFNAGAHVTGYSLLPPTDPSLFELAHLADSIDSRIGDVRDFNHLKQVFEEMQPEIVFHLAAQPLVRESYRNPRETYEINVMGTVNVMECVRLFPCVKSVLNVTTDKVYQPHERQQPYRENDPLDGYDPYSNSKSCSELATHSYISSFFEHMPVAVSTARAGNVIGGGDFAKDRIVPDCIRAVSAGRKIGVRNPNSVRPYQHVLEPLFAYLMIASKQYNNKKFSGFYNIGPDDCDCITTGQLTDMFCRYWGEDARWENQGQKDAPHEAAFLKLDCTLIKSVFGWKPHWNIERCMEETCRFSKILQKGGDILKEMDREIEEFRRSQRYD